MPFPFISRRSAPTAEERATERWQRRMQELAGRRVMVITNEDAPILVGKLVSLPKPHCLRSSATCVIDSVPVVESAGISHYCNGVLLPFNEALLTFLSSLPCQQRWALARDMSVTSRAAHWYD